jgi:hypothetical protein
MRQYSPNEVSLAIVDTKQRGMPYQRCVNVQGNEATIAIITNKQRGMAPTMCQYPKQ